MDSADDAFQVNPYITGLGEFVLECQTHMTIAIQGAWRSGKTSTMYMVKQYLTETQTKKKVKTIWFNTWQFSQFNMDDQITITFLQHFVKALESDFTSNKKQWIRKAGREALNTIKKVVVGASK